jgi:hypothetical protein
MSKVEDIIRMLENIEGSVHVFRLDDATREKVVEIERDVKAVLGISCVNLGVEECLHRKNIIVVVKDSRFRPPPEPTVLLVADGGDVILGREIFPHERKEFEGKPNILFLSQDFIVYTDRMPKTKEIFVMPPVAFPELSELPEIENVVSCSPSPPADMYVRAMHGLPDDPRLASILIGYDNSER